MYSGNRHELGVRSSHFMGIHSYIFETKNPNQYFRIYSNSFVYIRKKKQTNTFVYIRIHSYIFEKKHTNNT